MNEYIDKNIEPMVLLPRWAYIDSEWSDIENQTVCIINGTRYMNKKPEQIHVEEVEDFTSSFLQ